MAKSRASGARGPRKRAVLVGINQYPGQPLKGCVNDAIMIGQLLIKHFGFTPGADMRLLVDQRATKQAILDRLKWLAEGARGDDILVFHYSGHGAQVPDRHGDEVDALDECICPIDHNWDDPLTDDDLAAILGSLPPGTNLTAILDCCHSGTGLRALGPELLGAIKRLVPPPDIRFRAVKEIEVKPGLDYFSVTMTKYRDLEVRRFGESAQQTGILIAGCRADQSAKDTLIEGDYHGALTYSLYQAVNENGPSQGYGQWVETATRILKGYHVSDQDPQLEGPPDAIAWRLFSTTAAGRVSAKRAAPTTGNRHVVYVHGIGEHREGYSDVWWEALKPYVPSVPDDCRHEVLWSDLVTPVAKAIAQPLPGQADLAESIKDVLGDRALRQLTEGDEESAGEERSLEVGTSRAFLGIPGLDAIDDFVKYLLSQSIRQQVIGRFRDVVQPLLERGAEVEVISHSWGTVVAYEAMRLMDDQAGLPKAAVRNFFTAGSALSIAPVKRLLLPTAQDGQKPRVVHRWINLNARYDVVGGPLKGNPFEVDFEYLQLKPVGCGVIVTPACAHGSYFRPQNKTVNQGIFGQFIENQ